MHKYRPRLHVIRTSEPSQIPWSPSQVFFFPDTDFVAVTAYQVSTQFPCTQSPLALDPSSSTIQYKIHSIWQLALNFKETLSVISLNVFSGTTSTPVHVHSSRQDK